MKSAKTKEVIKLLSDNGFECQPRGKSTGSHSVWKRGIIKVSIPDGHTNISPGVMRKIHNAINMGL